MNSELAVVVVHWNGTALLQECLRSLQTQSDCGWSLVVVDNASQAEERDRLQALCRNFPRCELIWNETNVGYAGGANLGARRAIERGARWILLTSQDTSFDRDAIEQLIRVAGTLGDDTILGPLVLDRRTGRVLSAGERASVWALALPRRWSKVRQKHTAWYRVPGLLGCTLFFSAKAWQRLGGFSEEYFAYYEEVDLCLRGRQLGLTVALVPAARVWHHGWRGFASGFTAVSAELKARNVLLLFRKHARAWHYPVVLPVLGVLFLISAFLYGCQRDWEAVRAVGRGILKGVRGQAGPLTGREGRQKCGSAWESF